MQTYADYMRTTIIETVSETTDEDLLSYIYTTLMAALTSEKQEEDS